MVAGCDAINRVESILGITPPPVSVTTIPTEETLRPPSETPPPEQPRKLTLILWVPPQFAPTEENPGGTVLIEHLAAFEQENPGLNVEVRVKSLEGDGGLLASLGTTTAAAPEALPGLVLLNRSDLETAALKGLIFPITSRAIEYNTPDYFPFIQELTSYQGIQYGLPLLFDPLVMAYNSRLIAFPPNTWSELITQGDTVLLNLNDPMAPIPFTVYLSNGGALLAEDGRPVLEPDPLTRTYQFFFNGANANVFPAWLSDLRTNNDAWDAYAKGQGIYALVWASQALRNPVDNTAITTSPTNPSFPVALVDGWMLCITNPTTENSKYDLLLADYLLEPEFLARWSETSGYLPAQHSVLAQWTDQSVAETLTLAADQAVPIPNNEVQQMLGSILNQNAISLVRRQTSPMQAVTDTLTNLENQ
jgi:ABC-type glycerol-3-phosphate transport system substrate-binding protein